MFKNLMDFGYKRTGLEAFGFYIASFIIGLIIVAIANSIMLSIVAPNVNTTESAFEASKITAPYMVIISCIYTTLLAVLIMKAKGLFKDFNMILLLVATIALTFYLGNIVGLIPVAILSAVNNQRYSSLS